MSHFCALPEVPGDMNFDCMYQRPFHLSVSLGYPLAASVRRQSTPHRTVEEAYRYVQGESLKLYTPRTTGGSPKAYCSSACRHAVRQAQVSNQRDYRFQVDLTQDLPEWRSTWTVGWLPADGSNSSYRIANISTVKIHVPYLYVSWVYNPTPDWSLKIQGDNILPYRFELEQDIYSGPRNSNGLQTVQDVFTRTRPRLFVQLRKTF